MSFRFKLVLASMVLLSLVFGLGGSFLISVSFTTALDHERESALHSYKAVQNTLLLANSISTQNDTGDIVDTLAQLDGQSCGLWSGVRLVDGTKELYSNGASIPEAVFQDGFCKVEYFSHGERRYIHVSGSLRANESVLYLEICSDATYIYEVRETQLTIYRRLLAAVLVVGCAGSWVIAVMLTRPLSRLSRATRELASGNLSSRVHVNSGDELEALAGDFNIMAQRLEANIDELTDTMRRQEEFMGSFAHELKTPMTSIIGYADLLRSRDLTEDERQEAADYIFSEGRRLESLSLKLLDLLVLRRHDFSLRDGSPEAVISSVVRLVKPILARQGITIKYRCENGTCLMEPDLVKSLLINLIDNARKSIDGTGSIFLLEKTIPRGCRIQITDTGRGIPQEELQRITEAFYRVDKSRSRAQGGAGLGLALCNEIVKLHHGTMEFQSIQGKGTSVLVRLRAGEAERDAV